MMGDKQLQLALFVGFSFWAIISIIYLVGYHRYSSDLIGSIYEAIIFIFGMGVGVLLKTIRRKKAAITK